MDQLLTQTPPPVTHQDDSERSTISLLGIEENDFWENDTHALEDELRSRDPCARESQQYNYQIFWSSECLKSRELYQLGEGILCTSIGNQVSTIFVEDVILEKRYSGLLGHMKVSKKPPNYKAYFKQWINSDYVGKPFSRIEPETAIELIRRGKAENFTSQKEEMAFRLAATLLCNSLQPTYKMPILNATHFRWFFYHMLSEQKSHPQYTPIHPNMIQAEDLFPLPSEYFS